MIFFSNDGLARLQLDSSATERDVKKAYARELKLINPATQQQAFADLRQAYEGALAQVRFTAQFAGSSGGFEQADGEGASLQGEEDVEGGTHPNPAADAVEAQSEAEEESRPAQPPEPDFVPGPTESQAPAPGPASLELPSNLPFYKFVDTLAFSSSDFPAAQAALRRWLAQDELMLMAAREAFELELMEALASRRFGQRTAVMFLAASEAFYWDSGRHSQLERMGPVGAYISSLLYEMAVLDAASQQRWLALTETPDPKKALTLLKDAERMESLSPVLAGLFFADGHIQAWHQARDHAPVLLRGGKLLTTLFRSSAMLRGALLLLMIPVVIGIMAAVLSVAQVKETTRASSHCDGYFASAMTKGWKDMSLHEVDQLAECARGVPPLLCSDRTAMMEVLTIAQSVRGGERRYHYIPNGILVNLSDGRRFGAAGPMSCPAVLSFGAYASWLDQGDETAARQLIADIAKCPAGKDLDIQSPALLKLLAQTDAWPAQPSGRTGKPVALSSLITQPDAASYAATPYKPWPACATAMNYDLQPHMGQKEWLAAAARAKSPYDPEMAAMLKTLSRTTGLDSATLLKAAEAVRAASAANAAAAR